MYHETKRILKNAMAENKLIVFVGAGASVNSGVPLWGDAIKKIKEKLEPEFGDLNDYLKIPQFYYNSRGFKEYNELIKEIFSYESKMPNEIHKCIFELKPAHIITTNYDDFLEKTSDQNGEFLEIIERDADIPYAKNDRLLIKMHGGFKYDNYILKEDDYLNYGENFKLTETLIKALIARNTILFVGYSFDDPDTKQIFNWTKNALGNDFQRAYMIVAHQPYNQILLNYYKNLGINLIFSEYCMSTEENKKFNDNNFIFEKTLCVLKYFLSERNEADIAQTLTNKLLPYQELNHILLKYIQKAITWQNGQIIGNSMIIDTANYFELLTNANNRTDKSLSTIYNSISKTLLQSFQKGGNLTENGEKIIFIKENPIEIEEKYFHAIDSNDLIFLEKFSLSINVLDPNVPLKHKFMAAFAFYKLEQIQQSIKSFKELSQYCKTHKLYVWHFIAEYNIKSLKKQNILSDQSEGISIANLQEILFKYGLQTDENNFLLEIANFNLFYYAYYEVCELAKKCETASIWLELQNIYKLELYCLDLHEFITNNFLAIGNFIEIRKIFQEYVFAALYSNTKPEEEHDGLLGAIKAKTFRLPELSPFAIMLCAEYFTYKDLQLFFSQKSINEIILSNDAQTYLIQRANNYLESKDSKKIKRNDNDILNLISLISSKTLLPPDKFNDLFSLFLDILEKGYFSKESITLISNYVVDHNKDKIIIDTKLLKRAVTILIDINNQHQEDLLVYDYNKLNIMLKSFSLMLHEIDSSYLLEEKDTIKIFNAKGALQLSYFHKLCDDSTKARIVKTIEESLIKSDRVDFELYWTSLINGVIKPNIDVENHLLHTLPLESLNSEMEFFPDPIEDAKNKIINLKLNGFLIKEDEFSAYFMNSNDLEKFLFDPDNFDYNMFKISWLNKCNLKLLNALSEQKNAKKQIANCFKQQYLTSKLNDKEIEIYFNYFA